MIREIPPNAKDLTQKNAYRNWPLSEQDRSANRHKSKVHARIEHIFGVDEAAVWIEQMYAIWGLIKMPTVCLLNVR